MKALTGKRIHFQELRWLPQRVHCSSPVLGGCATFAPCAVISYVWSGYEDCTGLVLHSRCKGRDGWLDSRCAIALMVAWGAVRETRVSMERAIARLKYDAGG